MAKVLKMRKGVSPVFAEPGNLREHRDDGEVERFVEGILRTRGEMPLQQFTDDYPFDEEVVVAAAERLPSVVVLHIGSRR